MSTSNHRYSQNLIRKCLAIVVTIVIAASMWIGTQSAYALSIPKITIDNACLTQQSIDNVQVNGSVSIAKGQPIDLYAKDGETLLSQVTVGSSGGAQAFSIKVPYYYALDNASNSGTVTVYVQSQSVKGLAASKKVKADITIKSPKKSQTITGASDMTLTNLKTTATIKAKASSGLKVTYKSSNSQVVFVKSTGEIKRKKNGKATITISQAGNSAYLPVTKTVTVTCRNSTRDEQVDGAVDWAVKIANDNSFTYGTGQGAHHNGCYYCGTNYGPRKYMKPSKKYKKTYCCNPFVHAAYAHGAKNPKMLKGCKAANGIGMTKNTFYKFGCWKCVGKPSYSKLKKGDVLVKSTHVAMFIGNGKMVEASGGNWSTGSIAVKKMSKSRYNGFSFVMRYTGY